MAKNHQRRVLPNLNPASILTTAASAVLQLANWIGSSVIQIGIWLVEVFCWTAVQLIKLISSLVQKVLGRSKQPSRRKLSKARSSKTNKAAASPLLQPFVNRSLRRKLLPGLVMIALFLTGFAVYRSQQAEEIEAGWFNDNWLYRRAIQVTNNTSEETDVYISVTIDTSDTDKFQGDCGDLRFTKQNGQQLDYYISSGCGTVSTVIHVNFDTFPAGAQTIYYYYGNSTAENGFSASGFGTEASNYTIGSIGSEEQSPGPAAYWKFDEGTGTTAYDSSGQGNHGTLTNSPTWQPENMCISGSCLEFDGLNEYIRSTNVTEPITEYTVSAWIYPHKTSDGNSDQNTYGFTILSDDPASTGNRYPLWLRARAGEIRVNTFTADVNGVTTSGANITNDTWHHITVTAIKGDASEIYVNSKKVHSWNNPGDSGNWDGDFYIGELRTGRNIAFDGLIDEVKVYNYIRSEEEIKADYIAGASAKGSSAVIGHQPEIAPITPLSDNLVAHWKFNAGYGTTAHDSSPHGNHGTLGTGDSTPSWTNNGKIGKALSFDGVSNRQYVNAPHNASIDIRRTITISLWFKVNSWTGAWTNLINKMDDTGSIGSRTYSLFLNNGGYIHLCSADSSGQEILNTTTGSIELNKWQHYVAVIDRNNGLMKSYINGKENSSGLVRTTDTISHTYPLTIGIRGGYEPFDGLIDEVKIYNSALTENEIRLDYNQGKSAVMGAVGTDSDDNPSFTSSAAYCIPGDDSYCAPPIVEWKFDEKQGTTAYDTSGSGNDGTLTNGPTWKSAAHCQQGACLEFDGVENYINAGENPIIGTSAFTLQGWIKTDSHSTYGLAAFIGNASSTQSAWIGWCAGAQVGTSNSIGGGFYGRNYGSGITDNNWHFVALSFDGGSSGTTILYVDGRKKTEDTYTPNLQSTSIMFGKANTGTSYWFDGLIDQVRIYDYARTPAQIAWDYNRGAPVGHWKFDACEGTTAYDVSGNENNGSINIGASGSQTSAGTCTSGDTLHAWYNGREGRINSAMSFDGTDDYVEVVSSLNLDITGALTLSAWVKINTVNSLNYSGIAKYANMTGYSNQRSYGFWFSANTTTVSAAVSDDGTYNSGHYTSLTSTSELGTNSWRHVTVTFEPSTYMKIYIDGKLDAETTTGVMSSIFNSTAPLWIGTNFDSGSSTRFHNGLIDDVRIYNYALTDQQIKILYNDGAVRFSN